MHERFSTKRKILQTTEGDGKQQKMVQRDLLSPISEAKVQTSKAAEEGGAKILEPESQGVLNFN